MLNFIYQVVRTARPRQWLKNLTLFAAPVFAGTLFYNNTFYDTFKGFFAFCLISSGVYFMNDLFDLAKDRQHPIKKNRPLASGKITQTQGMFFACLFITASIIYGYLYVGSFFTLALIVYLLIPGLAYSLYFRNIIILEALFVASGFIIRVFAGGFASESSISSWLVLTAIGSSLLIAFGKRRSEKTILQKHAIAGEKLETRKTLRYYPDSLLDSMISTAASFCLITYSLFTFQISPQNASPELYRLLPSIIRTPKWMMLTIPLVIYGVARYLYVIYEKNEGESPERVLLSDKPLFLTVLFWGLSVLAIVYLLPYIFSA